MRRPRVVLAAVALVVLAAVAGGWAVVGRQARSYVTHVGGSPTRTWALKPYGAAHQPELRIAVAGDVGSAGTRSRQTGLAIGHAGEERRYDALLLLGDNVYPAGDPAAVDRTVFRPFAPVLRQGTPLLAVLGNHDVLDGHGDHQVAALGQSGRWWARTFGEDILVVGLDSNQPDNPRQRAWLEERLRSSTARWKVVALHHPAYSAGYQGSSLAVRKAFGPLFRRYGVQLVLSGHDHDYQRDKPIGGVTYVVSGAAAEVRRTGHRDFTAVAWAWHHFVDLSVYPDHLLLRAVNQDGRVFDQAVIRP